jgi:Winged helix DNA-binding domain
MSMTLLDVARLRLRNQRVTGERLASPQEVVAWLGCVQSQEYSLAKWSLGVRVGPGLHEADVDAALASGAILRTHILRPTWHYVAPADLREFMRLTAPRVLSGSAGRMGRLELDERQIRASFDIMAKALSGGRQLTRLELQVELERAGLNPDGQRVTYMVIAAELNLLIVSGVPRGDKPTYTLLDEWVPASPRDSQPFDRDRALADLALRYFTSHGPASAADFTWWSGLTVADATRGLSLNTPALESIDVAGETFWWAGDVGGSADSPVSPTVYLMQAFDEYVVAYRSPRTPINVAGLASPAVLQRPPFYHAVFVDSQLAGFWRRLTAEGGYRIETSMLRTLSHAEQTAFDEEVARYAEFAQRQVNRASM